MVAGALALAFGRLVRLPSVPVYIIAGILIGPFTLPGIFISDSSNISLLAEVGLVVLLFYVGVEFGWERIRKVGVRVLIIGIFEIISMIFLGYYAGIIIGLDSASAFVFGSALAFSSSAALVKILGDNKETRTVRGQLIVGILVVEDFAAVVLLASLSGLINHGAQGGFNLGFLTFQIGIFTVGALVFGGLFAPKLLKYMDKSNSMEFVLIGALGVCFGMGLIARESGLSAGAGAFLIGTVLGDTKHREKIVSLISPLRDVFAALFFVSTGMLLNIHEFYGFILPAMVATLVIIFGKVIFVSFATYLSGHNGKTSMSVGTGMAQSGEFSLAIGRLGEGSNLLAAPVYPAITASVLLTSVIYIWLNKSSVFVFNGLKFIIPSFFGYSIIRMLNYFRRLVGRVRSDTNDAVKIGSIVISLTVNLLIIMLVVAVGVSVTDMSSRLMTSYGSAVLLFNTFLVSAVVTLVVHSGILMLKATVKASESIFLQLNKENKSSGYLNKTLVTRILYGVLAVSFLGSAIIFVPKFLGMFSVPNISSPLSVIIVILTAVFTAKIGINFHTSLNHVIRKTLLGADNTK